MNKFMRYYFFILLFVCVFTQISVAQSDNPYDDLLEEFKVNRANNLIFLDIDSDAYKGRAAIENADLFLFLKKTKGINEKTYKLFVKDLLENNKKLNVCTSNLEEARFILLKGQYKQVNETAKKGKDAFIKQYFQEELIKYDIINEVKDIGVMYAIADKLFEWKITTYVDDITALIAIYDYENVIKN